MQAKRRALAALMTLTAVSSVLAAGSFAPVAAASGGFCSAGGASYPQGTTIKWIGGDGHSWTEKDNWSSQTVPDADMNPAYQTQYVCIGHSAHVTIPGDDTFHIAGIDVGQGADLTVQPLGGLYLGAAKGSTVSPSSVDKGSMLRLDASVLGGNSPLTVSGTLHWTGQLIKNHKKVATQTGAGPTTIASGGRMLVDGTKFGGAGLTGGREIDNFGTITFTDLGYVAMDNGTQLVDKPHSTVNFDGEGGIYRGSTQGGAAPAIQQAGAVVRHGKGTNLAVVAVPVSYGTPTPTVKVVGGRLVLNATRAVKASVSRGTAYGIGSCEPINMLVCRESIATPSRPEGVLIGASSESASPKVNAFAVSLGSKKPGRVHGHAVLGRAIQVTAPTKKTTHSTHLTFTFDKTTKGLKASTKPIVYRGHHRITLCKVHGLTAENTSCVFSQGVAHSGHGTAGDLTVVLITIQPNARWLVAR